MWKKIPLDRLTNNALYGADGETISSDQLASEITLIMRMVELHASMS